ncbi:MAG: tRNA (guanosine(46)-N7)-methyltransferase TrmB [Alphaproteobacteria bacterium]
MHYRFYGRKKTHKLNPSKRELIDAYLPKFDIQDPQKLTSVFKKKKEICIEVGFGYGEHLLEKAASNPSSIFIGCELFLNGIAALLKNIKKNDIQNIFIFPQNAFYLFQKLLHSSVNNLFLLFPDPWPKRRHNKRRFIQIETLFIVYKLLTNDGKWYIATDHKDYSNWILKHFFSPIGKILFDTSIYKNRPDFLKWPNTRYEKKAISSCIYIICSPKKLSLSCD